MCRSPLIERLFEVYADENGFDCEVASAGLMNHLKPMSENSIAVLREMGIDAKTHLSALISQSLVDESDLIIAMTDRIRDKVVEKFNCDDKTFSLSDEKLLGYEVEDPYGFDMDVYREVGDALARVCPYILSLAKEMQKH